MAEIQIQEVFGHINGQVDYSVVQYALRVDLHGVAAREVRRVVPLYLDVAYSHVFDSVEFITGARGKMTGIKEILKDLLFCPRQWRRIDTVFFDGPDDSWCIGQISSEELSEYREAERVEMFCAATAITVEFDREGTGSRASDPSFTLPGLFAKYDGGWIWEHGFQLGDVSCKENGSKHPRIWKAKPVGQQVATGRALSEEGE